MSDSGGECPAQALACGQDLSAALGASQCTEGPLGPAHFAERFTFSGQAGDLLIVQATWGFDGYLLLVDPDGLVVAENDNATSTGDSLIQRQLAQSGSYTIWASSYAPGVTGPYDLSVLCDSPPGPDLAPDAPGVSTTTPLPGAPLTLTARLWNLGDAAADSTTWSTGSPSATRRSR